jgi:TRAP-type C4-dicarboxylate transport system permease small subunit
MRALFARYDKLEEYVLVGSLGVTVALVFLQVIMRYVFNNSLYWSEELTRYIFIWQIWLGASIGLREKKHIKVEVLESVLSPAWKLAFDILASLIWLAANGFLLYSGTRLVIDLFQKHSVSTALQVPLWIVYAALPVSTFVIIIRQLLHLWDDVKAVSHVKEA